MSQQTTPLNGNVPAGPPTAPTRATRATKVAAPAPAPVGGKHEAVYDPGTPSGGKGGERVHPAAQSDGALNPAGHRAYCARNVQDAIAGAGGVSNQSSTTRRGIRKNDGLTWAQKQLALRRAKRADRRVVAAYQALAKAWLNKAKVRENTDAEINASKKTRTPAGTYTTN